MNLAKMLYKQIYNDELTITQFENQHKALELLQRAKESVNDGLRAEIDEFLALSRKGIHIRGARGA